MPELPYRLERTVLIHANRETVFLYFSDSARWAKWWGEGSTIDARPGGKVYIRHPGGVETVGEVLEAAAPERIVFTYGYASGNPIPPGSSQVTIRLDEDPNGTRLYLRHDFAEANARDQHIQGWRFQLSVFANVVANEAHANAAATVDAWYGAWSLTEDKAREEAFARIVTRGIRFRNSYSLLDGLEDLTAHTGAAQRFMPGITLRRKGEVRHCQGMVLAEWIASAADGTERMSGTSVFVLTPDGRLESVTSL
ncbi:MAG: SRPBCC domain-containing protein [Bryobacterales bacterium]|nr:SRPBCC domain-containing protein [Bryobacterales bacterium]MBV9399424.1 SRPBCC domain-containing protein [Bryobacterales bacterium]